MDGTNKTGSNRYIEFGAKTKNGFTRNHFVKPSECEKLIKKFKMQDTYFSAYTYSSTDVYNSDLLGDFYIDLDADLSSDEAFNKLRNEAILVINYIKYGFMVPEEYIKIYYSGAKGLHIIVLHKAFNVTPIPYLNIIYKKMAEKIIKNTGITTLDTQIYDNRRLFRVPNTINSKTGLFKIPLRFNELTILGFNEIKELAKTQRVFGENQQLLPSIMAQTKYADIISEYKVALENREKKRRKDFKKPSIIFMPSCIKNLIENGASVGIRNNCTAFYASYLMQNGFDEDEIIDQLLQWNLNCNMDELQEKEIETTVRSIYRFKHTYGCSKAKELGLCGGEDDCRIARAHYDKIMREKRNEKQNN